MYLKSTLDPLSKSVGNVPVAIFTFGKQSKLLRIFEDYEDTLRLVSESFNLEGDVVLSLRTSAIDVFQGKEVEIDESAYVYVRPCLCQVEVGIVGQVGRRQQKRAQEKSPAISPITPESPPSLVKDGFESEDLTTALSTVIHLEGPLNEQPLGTPIPDGIGKGVGGLSRVADTTMGGKVDHSQKYKKLADGEYSDDQLEAPQDTVVLLECADNRPITEPEHNDEGVSNSQKKFKPAATFPKPNKAVEIGSPTKVKKGIVAEPSIEVKPNTSVLQLEEDPRFEITIISPRGETAQFKTRGKHPVRKVLAAACKTFDIKDERARLILCVSTEEGGEIQTDEFDCPAEETMSQCGVDGNAKLFVRVEPDYDDEED